MKTSFLVMVFVLLLTPFAATAIKVPGLYEAEVPVADQEVNTRRQAIESAMRAVLIKLTGDHNASGRAALSPVIERAEHYVQQYRYLEDKNATDGTSTVAVRLKLGVQFDESNLNNTLRDLGVPVWGKERPSLLVWIAMEDEISRRILDLETSPDYFRILDDSAGARGIVLLFPLFDLEDTANIRASDIWGGFNNPVINASRRYHADSILVGRIESSVPGIWEGRWTVFIGEDVNTWTTEGAFPEAVLEEGINSVTDILAGRFSQSTIYTESGEVEMTIIDVFTVEQYARTLQDLQSLSTVSNVQVTQVDYGKIIFKITALGGERSVSQAINFGRTLEAVRQDSNAYRLLP